MTSQPDSANRLEIDDTISPNPPALEKGAHSGEIMRIFIFIACAFFCEKDAFGAKSAG